MELNSFWGANNDIDDLLKQEETNNHIIGIYAEYIKRILKDILVDIIITLDPLQIDIVMNNLNIDTAVILTTFLYYRNHFVIIGKNLKFIFYKQILIILLFLLTLLTPHAVSIDFNERNKKITRMKPTPKNTEWECAKYNQQRRYIFKWSYS